MTLIVLVENKEYFNAEYQKILESIDYDINLERNVIDWLRTDAAREDIEYFLQNLKDFVKQVKKSKEGSKEGTDTNFPMYG